MFTTTIGDGPDRPFSVAILEFDRSGGLLGVAEMGTPRIAGDT